MNDIQRIRPAVELVYDLQKLRVATGNRYGPHGENAEAVLPEDDVVFLKAMGASLQDLEKEAVKHLRKRLKGIPIWESWLSQQRGVGPAMGAMLVATIDIEKATTVSKIWRYAGLDVMKDGRGRRRKKGEKLTYNPWFKTKLVGVLADIFIKVSSWNEEEDRYEFRGKPLETDQVWRRFYDNYKHRKQTQLLDVCMACNGKGTYKPKDSEKKTESKCTNCNGTGGPAPWGKSDGHRSAAAKRYMIKMFLLELWKVWRELEGLDVRPSYQEEYLGHAHG